jgi:hypothetical protein
MTVVQREPETTAPASRAGARKAVSRFHQQQPQLLPLLQANWNVGFAASSGCCGVLTVGSGPAGQALLGQRLAANPTVGSDTGQLPVLHACCGVVIVGSSAA